MLLDHRSEYQSGHEAIRTIAPKIVCYGDTLHARLRQHEREQVVLAAMVTLPLMSEIFSENDLKLRRSNDILRQVSAYFAKAEFNCLWKK